VQIDDDVVSFTPKPSRETEIISDPAQARSPRRDDHFVEVRILSNHRKCLRLDKIRKMRVPKRPLQRPDERRCKNNVSDEAQTN